MEGGETHQLDTIQTPYATLFNTKNQENIVQKLYKLT